MDFFFAIVIGALMGSLPTGRAVAFIANDPTLSSGTGNPGPLVWLKQGHLGFAVMGFVLEAGKIIAAMQLAWLLSMTMPPLLVAGVAAVVGHGHSVFSKFRPCRSFSVVMGFVFATSLWAGLLLGALWLGVFAASLRQHRATLYVLGALPVVLYFLKGYEASFAGVILFAYSLWHYRRGLWQAFRNKDLPWPKNALIKTLQEHRL